MLFEKAQEYDNSFQQQVIYTKQPSRFRRDKPRVHKWLFLGLKCCSHKCY